jgi:predicted nucleotidyltransferase
MPANYTIESIKPYIIFSAVMGSHAYGTNIETSDRDIRGVFIQPLGDIFKYGYIDQVADKTSDIVYYELKRFLNLVKTNNPNILELLNAPEDCIIHKYPLYDMILEYRDIFITKKCRWTFAGYAIEQIKKARGYNKKMNWEESEMRRKTVLDFCYVLVRNESILLKDWLKDQIDFYHNGQRYFNALTAKRITQDQLGLSAIDHAHNLYAIYQIPIELEKKQNWGIVSDEEKANDIKLSSIPKGINPMAYLTFNKDAYSTHCKKYAEYQTWLKERNPDRVKMNKDHGKLYDSKNMMHCIRLLDMAIEIGSGQGIIVRRPDDHRKLLLSIRHGEMEFEDLMQNAESKIELLDKIFDESSLPENIDNSLIENLELAIRIIKYGI